MLLYFIVAAAAAAVIMCLFSITIIIIVIVTVRFREIETILTFASVSPTKQELACLGSA